MSDKIIKNNKENNINLGNGIKVNLSTTADLQGMAKDAYDHGLLTAKECEKLIVEAADRVYKASDEAAKLKANRQYEYLEKLKELLSIKEKIIKENADDKMKLHDDELALKEKEIQYNAYINNNFNEHQIKTYKQYTDDTMQQTFKEKVNNLDEKAENYLNKKNLDTDKKIFEKDAEFQKKYINKDIEVEKYSFDRTVSATSEMNEYAKEASLKTQDVTIALMKARVQAEEEKALAEIEIKKWQNYKKTFKVHMILYRVIWPIVGLSLGVAAAFIIMKVFGFLI